MVSKFGVEYEGQHGSYYFFLFRPRINLDPKILYYKTLISLQSPMTAEPDLQRNNRWLCVCHHNRLAVCKYNICLFLAANDFQTFILNRHSPWKGIRTIQFHTRT